MIEAAHLAEVEQTWVLDQENQPLHIEAKTNALPGQPVGGVRLTDHQQGLADYKQGAADSGHAAVATALANSSAGWASLIEAKSRSSKTPRAAAPQAWSAPICIWWPPGPLPGTLTPGSIGSSLFMTCS